MNKPITFADVIALRYEARWAGDEEQVRLCERAEKGDEEVW